MTNPYRKFRILRAKTMRAENVRECTPCHQHIDAGSMYLNLSCSEIKEAQEHDAVFTQNVCLACLKKLIFKERVQHERERLDSSRTGGEKSSGSAEAKQCAPRRTNKNGIPIVDNDVRPTAP